MMRRPEPWQVQFRRDCEGEHAFVVGALTAFFIGFVGLVIWNLLMTVGQLATKR